MTCPHADIRHCPLYHAAHDPHGACALGCADGNLHEGCMVDRGADYAGMVAELRARFPRLVAEAEWMAEAEQIRQQRARNLRAAGIH